MRKEKTESGNDISHHKNILYIFKKTEYNYQNS